MKFTRSIIFLLFCSLFFQACKKVPGAFNIFEEIIIKSNNQQIILPKGHYLAKIKINSSTLALKITKSDRETIQAKSNFPTSKLKFNIDNEVKFSAQEINQLYDLSITVKNESSFSPTIYKFRRCISEKVNKVKQIEYRKKYKVMKVFVTLHDPSTNKTVAQFTGINTVESKIIDKKGICH